MDNIINKQVVAKLLECIPKNLNPVNYLAGILKISNKSVYRRIKGEIPFTITEVMKLSKELRFSIDNILNQYDNEMVSFPLQANMLNSPHESIKRMLQQYYDHTLALNKAMNVESLIAINHIPMIFSTDLENLFRFFYYQWMHQNSEDSLKYSYRDAVIPPDIELLRRNISVSLPQNPNNTFIYDPNVFLTTINEIQYYYKRHLITDDELLLIKKDLMALTDHIRMLVRRGKYNEGGGLNLYLLDFNLKVSNCYIRYDDTVISNLMIYTINPINIFDFSVFSDVQKKWFDNIKKYAVLVTKSNEVLQAEYLEKQVRYIEDILRID